MYFQAVFFFYPCKYRRAGHYLLGNMLFYFWRKIILNSLTFTHCSFYPANIYSLYNFFTHSFKALLPLPGVSWTSSLSAGLCM